MLINKNKTVMGKKVWEQKREEVKELISLCRQMASEGSVLLKNDGVLPFNKGQKIAVFGRTQETYIKSGTGSGGLVRVLKKPCILDSLRENGVFEIDEELVKIYADWIKENPFDNGHGWATEPWSQKEMPLDEEITRSAANRNDVALIIIGRTAGEDKDNSDEKGSYRLSDEEDDMIAKVTSQFSKTVVVLNVGNLIDISFMDKYPVAAVLYVWQGGQEGANALADMLAGKISPCGKLTDTQSISIEDYPSYKNFGDRNECIYEEDIYVGYRYFETFAKDKVRYPFGFGLTYTTFKIDYSAQAETDSIVVTAKVKNVGNFASRQVVQVYYEAPCGKLGTPSRQLGCYKKTSLLKTNESETLTLRLKINDMASYDDIDTYSYLLEAGEYKIYAGTDVRSAESVLTYNIKETVVVKKLEEIMPPEKSFERFSAKMVDGRRQLVKENVSTRKNDLDTRIDERRPEEIAYSGDNGIKLVDVADQKHTIKEFIAQMTDDDLCNIVCGEGMNSPKVTPGTGGAFGGVTDSLLNLGIPVCCVTDGPSGLRLGNDYISTSLPNGYVFASSFDDELTEKIFEYEGIELFGYNVDALLGPGMNIHRHPLCGRNFEYFSEDPIVSGKIAAAMTRGLAKSGCSSTIKHFCCNNQELGRASCNVIVSERALREIYLKGFEIAVKEGKATAVMTSYNPVNGYHSASNYDLTTTVLRDEWGFEGFVMTDWWARCNCKGEVGTKENLKALVRAHNDVYMVCESAESKSRNLYEGLKEGYITRGDLQYCAKNILLYVMASPTFERFVDGGCKKPDYAGIDESKMQTVCELQNIESGKKYQFNFEANKKYLVIFETNTHGNALAQHPISLKVGAEIDISLSVSKNQTTAKRVVKPTKECDSMIFDFSNEVEIGKFTVKTN